MLSVPVFLFIMFAIVFLPILINRCLSRITIIEPMTLKRAYEARPLEYKIADIGTVPYAKSYFLEVIQASPYDLCNVNNNF